MSFAAHLEETPKPAGKTREPRRTLRLEALGAVASGVAANVLVHNVSATGLLFESELALAEGERIEIDLPHAGATWARVIWTGGRLVGCQFDAPISAAALSAAQLRSPAGQGVEIGPREEPLPDESFGVRLRRLRKEQGLTLAALASQLGVSKPTIWAWEQGKARPVKDRVETLAALLGVPASEVLSGRNTHALRDLLARSREQIASAYGTSPDKVRIMIEL